MRENATTAANSGFSVISSSKRSLTARERWSALDLATKFALAAAGAVALILIILVWWVSGQIARGIIYHTASNVALHLDDAFEPNVQSLIAAGVADGPAVQSFKSVVARHAADQMLLGITVWGMNGDVLFSWGGEQPSLPPTELFRAWTGSVEGRLDANNGLFSNSGEAMPPALHVFAPMHALDGKTTIAVLEVATNASHLADDVRKIRLKTAVVAGLLTFAMTALLFGIVRQGSTTIQTQEADLLQRIEAMRRLLEDNKDLQQRVIEAAHRSNETNDRTLRRIGAELHDGPAQLIALSLLRLEALRRPLSGDGKRDAAEDIRSIETLMRDCLNEVRQLSSGLALPKLEGVSVRRALEFAIMNHERHTKSRVERDLSEELPATAPRQLLTFLYRFAQEGLTNAHKHADGKGLSVSARMEQRNLVIAVHDRGPGFPETTENLDTAGSHGLGLAGIQDRLEVFSGVLEIVPRDGGGTSLIVFFDFDRALAHDGWF